MTETTSSTVLYQKWIGLFLFHKWYKIVMQVLGLPRQILHHTRFI